MPRKAKKHKSRITQEDYIKAIKKVDRELGLEDGFKSGHKIHKSLKDYKRKPKHKKPLV